VWAENSGGVPHQWCCYQMLILKREVSDMGCLI